MPTPFSDDNKDFTNVAHNAARRDIYPALFPHAHYISFVEQLDVKEDAVWSMLDGKLGIDRIAEVYGGTAAHPLTFTVQERFRRAQYASYRDVTITKFNTETEMPSELHKLGAQLFIYGYYDDSSDKFVDFVVINTVRMIRALIGGLTYRTGFNNRSKQSFISIAFNDLEQHGILELRHREEQS